MRWDMAMKGRRGWPHADPHPRTNTPLNARKRARACAQDRERMESGALNFGKDGKLKAGLLDAIIHRRTYGWTDGRTDGRTD